MYVIHIVPHAQEMQQAVFPTTVDADIWHRRMGHCHPRALKQLVEKPTTGVKFSHNFEAGECEVCAVSKSKKSAHPPSYRPRSNTRLEVVHVDLWGKHPVVLYGGCQSIAMFTDDMSRMRWVVLIRTKDEAVDALKQVVEDIADPEGMCVGKIRCDGGGEFKGGIQALAESLGIPIEMNASYIPQGNSFTRSLLLGAPHLLEKLRGEALEAAVHIRNRTPTDVLGGKAPLEVWESKPLGSMKHMHEWGALAFKHIEVRQRNGKLIPRAEKMYLVGYNTHNMTYRLWNPDRPHETTNSAEVSFREEKSP